MTDDVDDRITKLHIAENSKGTKLDGTFVAKLKMYTLVIHARSCVSPVPELFFSTHPL